MYFHKLKATLCVFFSICNVLTVAYGQVPFEVFVEAQTARTLYKTGIRHYTVWGNKGGKIVCLSTSSFLNEIAIVKNGEKVKADEHISELNQEYENLSEMGGNYTCRFQGLSHALDEHTFLYVLETNLAVNTSTDAFCATNVGNSGYLNEDVDIICDGNASGPIRWVPDGKRIREVILNEETIEKYSCQHQGNKSCNLSNIHIFPYLQVEITPSSYSADSRVLELFCNSTPPRLLYWRVFGSNGDILDLDNYKTSLAVDTNVTIIQSVGETTLRLSEAVPGGNSIHTVVCFTYETKTKATAARLTMQSDTNVVLILIIVVLLIIITILVIIVILMHINGKKSAITKHNVRQAALPPTPSLHNNLAYQSYNEQNANNTGEMDKDYAYAEY